MKILPIEKPYFSAYASTGHLLSILQAHSEMKPWIFNNFIQIFGASEDNIDFYDICIENCPFITFDWIEKRIILRKFDIIEFIIAMIDAGYYIIMMIDTKYLKNYDFQTYHDPMIYGYSKSKKELYIADHFKEGMYTFNKCMFDEMKKAFYIDPNTIGVTRYRREYLNIGMVRYDTDMSKIKSNLYYDYDKRLELNMDRIKESLIDYLHGRPTVNWSTRLRSVSEKEKDFHAFGIQCYSILVHHINLSWREKFMTHGAIHSFYTMNKHKWMMLERIRYMESRKCLKRYFYHQQIWEEIEEKSKIILNLYMKYCIRGIFNELEKETLIEMIKQIEMMEKKEIALLYKSLKEGNISI